MQRIPVILLAIQGLVIAFMVAANNTAAYDDVESHPKMTKRAVEFSNLDAYLKLQLNQEYGINTVFPLFDPNTQVLAFLMQGSTAEDHPTCRASTHFHNPLLTWTVAGASEALQTQWCYEYNSPYPGWHQYSALVWATGIETYGGPTTSRNKQTMGWDNARA